MNRTRLAAALCAALVTFSAATADALVRRHRHAHLRRHVGEWYNRTAISAYLGGGIPVGAFSSPRPGDGNHRSGALDWSVELEHFFAPGLSLGAGIANVTWEDRDDPTLETHLDALYGFFRYVAPSATGVAPYLRAGMGAQRVQFQDPLDRFRSDPALYVEAGAGLALRMSDNLGLNVQGTYRHAFTEDALVPDVDAIVGFDTEYWSFQGGVSLFFP